MATLTRRGYMFYTKSRNSEHGYNPDQIVEAGVERQE